jgi:hypothetical protein
MELFGVEMLTPSLIQTYQKETEAYIEDYYNNYKGSDSIRTSVQIVSATLKVTDWTEPSDPLSGGVANDTDVTAEDKSKVIVLDVTEPCTGESPLTVTFTLELEYQVENPKLYHLDIIISSPFLTVDSRSEYIADYLQSGDDFGNLYCSSRIVFPEGTSTPMPTIATTDKPIGDNGSDERDELKMLLYGIDLMTPSRIKSFEQETAAYIEDYYNNSTDDSDGIRNKVYDVSATVTVTDWSQPANPSLGVKRIFSSRKIGHTDNISAEDKAKVIVLDVTEPCGGEFPLAVTFTLKLQYRVDDPSLDGSDLIISSPFRTVDSRTIYIGDYLQSGDDFNTLYCSSQIIFSDGRTPVPTSFNTPVFPGGLTPSPSGLTSNVPTVVEPTLTPSLTNDTTLPTISLAPSDTLNGTSNATVVPTPFVNASVAPSILNGSTAPSVLNASIAPSLLKASIAPSILNGTSTAPSVSPNASSSVPTLSGITGAPTDTLPPWEMRLYGMNDLLEPGLILYDQSTATFIENFYNLDGVNAEGIRAQVSDMQATVEVVGQIPPTSARKSSTVHHGARKHRSKHQPNEEVFSFHQNKKRFDFWGGQRFLQEDPCSGPYLLLRMKITITYVTLDTNLTSEEILLEVFSTPEYRDDYLNNYLMSGVQGDVVFGDLTCTSELFETAPKSVGPTPAPILSSTMPSVVVGGNGTLPPVSSGNSSSVAPSAANSTIAPSASDLTGNNTSVAPSPAGNATVSSVAPSPSASNDTTATGVPTLIASNSGNTTTLTPPTVATVASSTPTIASNISNSGNTTTLTPPTVATVASSTPTIASNIITDDIFGDPQVRSSSTYDRRCSDVDPETRSNTEEIAIRFVYGVESKSHQNFFISDLEDLFLDFLTTSVLRCAENVLHPSVQTRMNRDVTDFGVIRIRYPERGEITSTSKSSTIQYYPFCWYN